MAVTQAPPATTGGSYTLQALAKIEPTSTEALYIYLKTGHKIAEMFAQDLDTTERLVVQAIAGNGARRNAFGFNLRSSARRATRRWRKAADHLEAAARELARVPRDYEREFEPLIHPGANGKPAWTFTENGKK